MYVHPVPDTDNFPRPGDSTDSHDEWLTIGQAAALMHQSISTLRRYDAQGVLKAERTLGGQRRYRRSVIEALMERAA